MHLFMELYFNSDAAMNSRDFLGFSLESRLELNYDNKIEMKEICELLKYGFCRNEPQH